METRPRRRAEAAVRALATARGLAFVIEPEPAVPGLDYPEPAPFDATPDVLELADTPVAVGVAA